MQLSEMHGTGRVNLQNKTQCVGFFTETYKAKHNTDGPFLLRDRKKVKNFPHKRGVGIRLSRLEKKFKN